MHGTSLLTQDNYIVVGFLLIFLMPVARNLLLTWSKGYSQTVLWDGVCRHLLWLCMFTQDLLFVCLANLMRYCSFLGVFNKQSSVHSKDGVWSFNFHLFQSHIETSNPREAGTWGICGGIVSAVWHCSSGRYEQMYTHSRQKITTEQIMPSNATKFIRVMYGRSDDRLLPTA